MPAPPVVLALVAAATPGAWFILPCVIDGCPPPRPPSPSCFQAVACKLASLQVYTRVPSFCTTYPPAHCIPPSSCRRGGAADRRAHLPPGHSPTPPALSTAYSSPHTPLSASTAIQEAMSLLVCPASIARRERAARSLTAAGCSSTALVTSPVYRLPHRWRPPPILLFLAVPVSCCRGSHLRVRSGRCRDFTWAPVAPDSRHRGPKTKTAKLLSHNTRYQKTPTACPASGVDSMHGLAATHCLLTR